MEESTTVNDVNLLIYKKDMLTRHLPYVKNMLEKVRNTEYEKKWQQMYTCIVSDKKR